MIKVKDCALIRQENEAQLGDSKGKKKRFYRNEYYCLVVIVAA